MSKKKRRQSKRLDPIQDLNKTESNFCVPGSPRVGTSASKKLEPLCNKLQLPPTQDEDFCACSKPNVSALSGQNSLTMLHSNTDMKMRIVTKKKAQIKKVHEEGNLKKFSEDLLLHAVSKKTLDE